MGLFGGGNSSTTTTTLVQDYTGTNAPGLSLDGAAGSVGLVISPQVVGSGSIGGIAPTLYNAPVYLTPSVNVGDSAIQAAQQTSQAAIAAQSPNANTAGSTLQNLLSGDNLYWIIGALVIVMFARGHAR
jgi:hypothetical protein